MSNPTAAVIAILLRAGEDNPRAYIAAVLDNMPRVVMALTRCALPDQVNPCETACEACLEEIDAALSTARATLLPGDAT